MNKKLAIFIHSFLLSVQVVFIVITALVMVQVTHHEPKIGDINSDGTVSIIDYTLLRLDIVDAKRLSIDEAQRADINNDGYANEDDADVIRDIILQE